MQLGHVEEQRLVAIRDMEKMRVSWDVCSRAVVTRKLVASVLLGIFVILVRVGVHRSSVNVFSSDFSIADTLNTAVEQAMVYVSPTGQFK